MAKAHIADVNPDLIWFDYDRNVRMRETAYNDLKPIEKFDISKHKPGMYEDILMNGLHTPLTVAELTPEKAREIAAKACEQTGRTNWVPKYRGIRGHRRFFVITRIRETTPHMFAKVPCQIYNGLTDEDELRLLVDHIHTKGLNEFEMYLGIKRLLLAGQTEERIASHMGVSRGVVQKRKIIAKLPAFVEENYRKRFDGSDDGTFVKFTDPDLVEWNKLLNQDLESGLDPENPESNFGKAWETRKNQPGKRPEPKSRTRKDIMDKKQLIKDPLLRLVMEYCAGDDVNIGDADDQLKALRAKVTELVTENARLTDLLAQYEVKAS